MSKVYNLTDVTLTNAATIYSGAIESSSSAGTLAIQASFANVSGTSAGTVTVQGTIDGINWTTISAVAGKFDFYASASETVIDGLVMQGVITSSPFKAYRFKVVGSGTQVTTCSFSYLPKLS